MKAKDKIYRHVRAAKAIREDIGEIESYNTAAAYDKVQRRIDASAWKKKIITWSRSAAAIIALPLLISTVVLSLKIGGADRSAFDQLITVSAVPGATTRIVLPDNSRVWIKGGSTVSYPVVFDPDCRKVSLSGEGYFEVESDPTHPFVVDAGSGLSVRAVGTEFNVMTYANDSRIETVLASGKVEIMVADTYACTLEPDQSAVFERTSGALAVREVNTYAKTAWKDGKLVLRDATADEMVESLSRWFNVDITLHNPSGNEYDFRATFTDESVFQVLDYLKMVAPIRWKADKTVQNPDSTYTRQHIQVWL